MKNYYSKTQKYEMVDNLISLRSPHTKHPSLHKSSLEHELSSINPQKNVNIKRKIEQKRNPLDNPNNKRKRAEN